MFSRRDDPRAICRFIFEGQPLEAKAGDSVAAALLAAGITQFRTTPATGAPRGPWCLMGVCFDCLVDIDGQANRQACQVTVAEGMAVRRMYGPRP
ncbi:MAG: (2Fe-2S)-binding protein [Acetobacteraceae bacterium]|nr:(2Fe-2S)-binding protein [Acetobacteraceae bacterium]